MKLLVLFFNNGQTERMELTMLSTDNAHMLARQMSAMPLVHTARLDIAGFGVSSTADYHDGQQVPPAGTFTQA
jgi:hypothetical protein